MRYLITLALLSILVLAVTTVHAQGDACYEDPSQPACTDYKMPEDRIKSNIEENCNTATGMPNMAGCSISRICEKENERGVDSGVYCTPFSVMKDTCVGMMGMKGCADLGKLCTNKSVVTQCETPAFPFPAGSKLREYVQSICSDMWMDGCQKCVNRTSGAWIPCDSFLVYSTLCVEMPGMPQCSAWTSYCSLVPRWDVCGGSPNSELPPEMRMYWHFSYADYVLFKEWVPRSAGTYAATVFACFSFAVIYECVKALIGYLENRWRTDMPVGNVQRDGASDPLLGGEAAVTYAVPAFNMSRDTLRGLMHMIYIGLHYWIMLVAMTYNVGLFLAVLAGHGVAYAFVNRFHRLTRTDNSCCST